MSSLQRVAIVFTVLVVVLSLFFAYKITSGKEVVASKNMIIDSSRLHRLEINGKEDKLENDPVSKLATLKKHDQKPADATILSWDLVDPEFRKSVVLVLRFDNLDRFQKSCLDNFLQENQIEHTLATEQFFDVRLKTKEIDRANSIVSKLATYDLVASLVILREPKPY